MKEQKFRFDGKEYTMLDVATQLGKQASFYLEEIKAVIIKNKISESYPDFDSYLEKSYLSLESNFMDRNQEKLDKQINEMIMLFSYPKLFEAKFPNIDITNSPGLFDIRVVVMSRIEKFRKTLDTSLNIHKLTSEKIAEILDFDISTPT